MSAGRLAGPSSSPPRARGGRRWLALGAILALLAVVVFGGQMVAAALRAPAAGPPVEVAPGVRLQPLPGWQLASPQRGAEPALLTRGSGNLAVLAAPTTLDAAGLASRYADSQLAPLASELGMAAPVPLRAASGHRAVALAYRARFGAGARGGAVAGEIVAVVTAGGTGVVFDAWAGPQVFGFLRDDARAMATTAEVG